MGVILQCQFENRNGIAIFLTTKLFSIIVASIIELLPKLEYVMRELINKFEIAEIHSLLETFTTTLKIFGIWKLSG